MRALLKGQYSIAAAVCLLGILLSGLLFLKIRDENRDDRYQEFVQASEGYITSLQRTVEFDFVELRSVQTFCSVTPEVTPERFAQFVATLIDKHPSLRGIEWVPRVPESARANWQKLATGNGTESCSIQERDRSGLLVPARGRDEYFPILYVEPARGNVAARGYDLANDPDCREAMTRARDLGKPVLTGKISLVNEPGNRVGVRMFLPVYRGHVVPATVSARQEQLSGYVVGIIRLKEIFEESLSGLAPMGIHICLQDETDRSRPALLYAHRSRLGSPRDLEPVFEGSDAFRIHRQVHLAGQIWAITCVASRRLSVADYDWRAWGAAGASLTLTGLLVAYLVLMARRHDETARFAEELSHTNERLKHEILERKQAQSTLQVSQIKYRTLYESSSDAILLLDPHEGFLNGNAAAVALFGCHREGELLSRSLLELSPDCQPNGRPSSTELERLVTLALRQGAHVFEWRHQRIDGSEFDAILMLTRMELENKRMLQVVVRDITEQKEMERTLRENEQYLQAVFDTVATGILAIDAETRVITDVNRAAAEEIGLRPNEIIGRHCSDFFNCSAQGSQCPFQEKRCTGIHHAERCLTRGDGTKTPVLKSVSSLSINGKSYLLDCFTNISAQKRAEEASQREAAKLSAMISGMEEGVVFADADNVVVEINGYLCRFLGKTREALLGKRIDELHHGAVRDRLLAVLEEYRRNPTAAPLVLQRSLAGTEVILRVQPIHRDGKYDGALLNVIDVGELVKARRQAEVANEAKSRFLANMSHEIRTPMTAILGYTDLMMDPNLSASNRNNYLAVIRRSGEHLLKLINDILDLSKIEAGKIALDWQRASLVNVLADVASLMRPRAEQRGIALAVEYRTAMPETILTDAARVRQTLVNLVGNAVKFTRRGTVRIVVSFLPEAKEGKPAVQIQVIDTGIGIRPEVLGQLFRPFTQGDRSVADRFGGSGLGLVISRHIAELLGGKLTAESDWGQGSTFTLTIPTGDLTGVRLLESPAEVQQETIDASWSAGDRELTGVHVLLAEDGFDNRELIQALLRRAGATVDTAENGRIAVTKAQAEQYDVILMDINMPEMDGYQATQTLREQGYTRPILALTANAMSGDDRLCLAAGCNEHLAKPIDRAKLIQTIAHYASGRLSATAATNRRETETASAGDDGAIVSVYANDPEIAPILRNFVERLDDQVNHMRQAWRSREHQQLQRLAHRLKGAGGSYGYPSLSEAALALENAAKASDDESEAEALEVIASLVQSVKAGFTETTFAEISQS